MFDQEQQVCRLAADAVLATQAYVRAAKARADTANRAAALERSLLSLVAEVYAIEFELSLDPEAPRSRKQDTAPADAAIHALAAQFIASLVQRPGEMAGAGGLPVQASVLMGNEFAALDDALRGAGYLEPHAALRATT
jgi:hypothetical protein